MPDEHASQPSSQLDETLDAQPYEPPRRLSRLAIAMITSVAMGAVASLLVLRFHSYAVVVQGECVQIPRWHPHLAVAVLVCGLVTIVISLMAGGFFVKSAFQPGLAVSCTVMLLGLLLTGAGGLWSLLAHGDNRAAEADCCMNLRTLAVGCGLYSEGDENSLPARMEDVFLAGHADSHRCMICMRRPGFWEGLLARRLVRAPDRRYTFVSGLKWSDPGYCVLAFDRHGDKCIVRMLDGNMEVLLATGDDLPDRLKKMLERTRQAVRERGGDIKLVRE